MSGRAGDPTSRGEWLDLLARAAAEHDWARCPELCFRVLYGLPARVQIGVAAGAARLYLLAFRSRWPQVTWPERIIADPIRYVTENGRELPEEPQPAHPGDAEFLFCLDALVLAAAFPREDQVLTAACSAAANSAATACALEAWVDDDPAALAAWRNLDAEDPTDDTFTTLAGRAVTSNSAAATAYAETWEAIVAIIESYGVREYPVPDPERVDRDLEAWKEHEMLLIVPGPDDA